MKYSEENLRKYIKKCFVDAFNAENRLYSDDLWKAEWIIIKNKTGVYQLYPFLSCKFSRVLRRVLYRLENNLDRNFGMTFGDTDELGAIFGSDIDFNYTQAMFKNSDGKNIAMSIFDEETFNRPQGECIPAYRPEKMIFKLWDLDPESFSALPDDDERRSLPRILRRDWDAFKTLYKDTFGTSIGEKYEIICSSGIKRL